MSSLEDVPPETFSYEIFPHMTYTDIVAFGKTSKRNYQMASDFLKRDSNWKQIISGQYFVNKPFPEIVTLVAKDEIIRKYALIHYLKILQEEPLTPLPIKHVKELLPEVVTIRLDDNIISGNKYFLQGIAAAIKWAKLDYRIYIRITEDGENDIELPLVKFSYIFIKFGPGIYEASINLNYQSHKINFDDLEVLTGIKTIFINNDLPFIGSYHNRETNVKVQIN